MPHQIVALLASFGLLATAVAGTEKVPAHEVTLTFFISGIECSACVEFVRQSVNELHGVSKADVEQRIDSFARITFDSRVTSAQQVAQAVSEAYPLHGRPYLASLVLLVPGYASGPNTARIDALFAQQNRWVNIRLANREKGEFAVDFLPLTPQPGAKGPQGWDVESFLHAMQDPPPRGLGLTCTVATED